MKHHNEIIQSTLSSSVHNNAFELIESIIDYTIFIINSEGIIKTWNVGGTKLFNYTVNEIMGKHFSILYSKNDIAESIPSHDLFSAGMDDYIPKPFDSHHLKIILDAWLSDKMAHKSSLSSLIDKKKN